MRCVISLWRCNGQLMANGLIQCGLVTPYGVIYIYIYIYVCVCVCVVFVNIGSGNGLLPNGSKPLAEPIMISY